MAFDGLRRALRPLGAAVAVTGAAALVNRRLRETGPIPHDRVGGKRIPWRWRGFDLYATEMGAGPTVLLVHGIYAGASAYEYRRLMPLLAASRRVVAFDLLGCGLSEMPDLTYSPELFVEQIVDAVGYFSDEPLTLVGSSLGAAFAIRAATRTADRIASLVTIGPTGLEGVLDDELGTRRRGVTRFVRSPIAGESFFNALTARPSIRWFLRNQSYADPDSVTPEVVDHYYAVTHRRGARTVPAFFVGGRLDTDVARDLPFVEAPVTIVWGREATRTNPVGNAEIFARLARESHVTIVPHAALLAHEEQPALVAAAILGAAARSFPERLERTVGKSAPAAVESTAPAATGEPAAGAEHAPGMTTYDLPAIFKSYDVRGIYPSQFSDEIAHGIGRAFVVETGAKTIAVGRDMRPSGTTIFEAFARGANEAGASVVDIGLVSTDALYFAVGNYGYDGGVMITASHNPATYNGMKFTRRRAEAISLDTGLSQMRDRIASGDLGPLAATRGTIAKRDVLDDFAQHCLRFVDPKRIKPFKIAIDAGNGMAGETVPYVFKHLPCEVIPLYFELDGEFPNHPASPIEPENMVDLQKAVLDHACDLGVAFDGDADRMFVVDEKGGLVGGDMVTALVGLNTLKRLPGAKILYNLICSRSVPEVIEKAGGVPVRSQVGHSLIKKLMREEDIPFGGEHSGHFYFRDNWYADSGMIALLQCLEVFSDANQTVSAVIAPIDTRFRSGEVNSRVHDIPAKLGELQQRYADGRIDHLDGVTIQYDDWWLNVRASNTEPLLRLNVEADTKAMMEHRRDEALALIRA